MSDYFSENRIRLITPDDDIGGGRVEVYHDGQWGTICDENWGEEAAEVVCKELGYSGAIFAVKKAHFGEGTGPVCDDSCAFVLRRLVIERLSFECRKAIGFP